jgi:hypothetical protein
MALRRNLSIGITVNLEYYENLRLEVSGEVCSEEDAEDLVTYLDTILSRLGRGTPETAERVDSYRRRVLTWPSISPATETPREIIPLPAEAPQPPVSSTPSPAAPPAETPRVQVPPSPPASAPVKKPATGETVTVSEKMAPTPPPSPALQKTTAPAQAPEPRKEAPVISTTSLKAKKEGAPAAASLPTRAPAPSSQPPSHPVQASAESQGKAKSEEFSCERCGEPITPVQRKLSRMFQNKDLCKKCLQQL